MHLLECVECSLTESAVLCQYKELQCNAVPYSVNTIKCSGITQRNTLKIKLGAVQYRAIKYQY